MSSPLRSREEFAELAVRVRGGDAAAEEEFVRLFAPRVEAMARGRLRQREDVDELVDDVLMAVLMALRKGAVREPGSLFAFVHGTALRLIQNRRRVLARQPSSQELTADLAGADAVASREKADLRHDCHQALARLSPADRQILYLTLVEGLKPGEIAKKLGLTSAAVRQRKSRAVKEVIAKIGLTRSGPARPL
jgi:RNA polymerase sigma-70 factor (ECF subfamily)